MGGKGLVFGGSWSHLERDDVVEARRPAWNLLGMFHRLGVARKYRSAPPGTSWICRKSAGARWGFEARSYSDDVIESFMLRRIPKSSGECMA